MCKVLLFQTTIIKGEIILKATLEELDFLQQQIACVISVEIKPDRRRILGEIYERMDILLEEEDQRDPKLFEEANLEAIARLREVGFHCQGCGNCCLSLGFELTLEHYETRRWRKFSNVIPSNYGQYYPADFMSIIAAARLCGFMVPSGDRARIIPLSVPEKSSVAKSISMPNI